MPYVRSRFSARRELRCFRKVVISGLTPPVTENKSGVIKVGSTLHILSSYILCWLARDVGSRRQGDWYGKRAHLD